MAKKKQLILVIVIAVVAVAVILAVVLARLGSSGSNGGDAAYVESVADISGGASSGTLNRFAGVVESEETWDVTVSQDQTVKEVLVAEGDEVSVGTPLLTYDTDEISLQLSQAKLELEESQNQVKDYNTQIKALEAEKKSAASDEQFNYTVQIQSLETSIKQAEYDQQSKQLEIDKLQKSLNEATVTSEIAGVVKEINDNGETDDNGNAKPYISILTTGEYRVKGLVNETNVSELSEGQAVVLRSRVDENQIWTGTIQSIDTENAESSNSNVYYDDGSDGSAQSSKYPFYVALDSSDGLMLGQHLYIEADEGQTAQTDGIWIYSGYLVFDDAEVTDAEAVEEGLSDESVSETGSDVVSGQTAYVWADNGSGKLEKREVTLGAYNAEMDMYEITSGLSEDDYIAWPMDGFTEGMATTTNIDNAMVEDVTTDEDAYTDEEMIKDSSVSEDGEALDEGTVSEDGVNAEDGAETGDGAADTGTSGDASTEN